MKKMLFTATKMGSKKGSLHLIEKQSLMGFTLLELLIAMVIFSTMSLMAYGGLHSVLTSNRVTQNYEIQLKELQRSMMFLEKDWRQLSHRTRHSGYSELLPALQTDLSLEGVVEFTRSGNPNPAEKLRSSLQRVRYVLEKGELQRWSWSYVDHLDGKPLVMGLMNSVEKISFRYLDKNNQWKSDWIVSDKTKSDLPKAVEINITHKHWGKIKRLIAIY
ncbi:MAG: type II secretion system minor pseudopilin GspJ [Cocleimonas sp.]|nr:type II secretion system minor pseudopilin GspJ [Cocleimonas sp.]